MERKHLKESKSSELKFMPCFIHAGLVGSDQSRSNFVWKESISRKSKSSERKFMPCFMHACLVGSDQSRNNLYGKKAS